MFASAEPRTAQVPMRPYHTHVHTTTANAQARGSRYRPRAEETRPMNRAAGAACLLLDGLWGLFMSTAGYDKPNSAVKTPGRCI